MRNGALSEPDDPDGADAQLDEPRRTAMDSVTPGGPYPPPGPVAAWRAMLETHRDVMDSLATEFRERHDLSVSDFDVLINIGPDEKVRHRDLAERVVLSRSAVSRLVDRLVARGFLTRRAVENDARGVLIALTPRGRAVRHESSRSNDAIVMEAFAGLDADDVATLQRLSRRISRTAGARGAAFSPPEPIQETT